MADSTVLTRRLFTIEEYERLGEAGILRADERIELIEGELVQMSPIGSRHAACVGRFLDSLVPRLPAGTALRVQDPVRLPPDSEPQPDLAIVKRRGDFYAAAHPGPEDIFLIIEVADTTLTYDIDVKLPVYAAAGIPEVWVADLTGRRFLIHREPTGGRYQQVSVVEAGTLSPAAFPSLVIRVEEMLG